MNINYAESFNFKPKASITPYNGYWQNGTWKFNMPEITAGAASQPSWIDIILHGNTALTLVNAKANSLEYLSLFGDTELLPETYLDTVTLSGGCEQRNLPSGYTQVEYLELATGGGYLPTGINATVDTDMGITASNITSNSAQILVAQCESGSDYFRIAKAGASQRVIGSFGSSTVTDNNTDGVSKFTARMNKSGFYVNGSLIGTFSNIPSSLTNVGEIDIFRGKYSDTTYFAYAGSRFHGAWVDDNIFLPCRRNSDNQLGVYNTKTGQFILPSGTGTFTAGPDVVPTPDTPIDIVCNNGVVKCNTNIFTTTGTTQDKYIDANGQETNGVYQGYSFGHTNYLKVKPNTTYTVSGVSKVDKITNHWVSAWSSNKTFIERPVNLAFPANSIGNEYSVTFTTTAETEYIMFNYVYTVDEKIKIYLNAYSFNGIYTDGTQEVVTDSLGNTANAERLLAVGNYKDTQEVISGSVTKRIGITILDGTETWSKSSTYTGSFYTNTYNPLDGAKVTNNPNVYCTHGFKVDSLGEYASASIGAFYWYSSTTINYKYDDGTATVAQFKQWLANQHNAGTPVIIVYPLATATTSTIPGQFLSKSPVTQTAGSISNLPIAITESQKTVPTPQQPLQINCNNGVVKVSKNLFDYEYFYDNYQIYIGTQVGRCPIRLQPNTQYTVSTNTEASSSSAKIFVTSGSAINWKPVSADNGILVNRPRTVTTDSNGYLCIGIYYTGGNAVPESDFENGTVWVQIEEGSTATTYHPYGIYVDGTTETVEITGKNLLDVSQSVISRSDSYTNLIHANGEISFTNTYTGNFAQYIGVYFEATVGKEYTISFTKTDSNVRVFESDVIKTSVGTDYGDVISSGYTFTATKKYVYIYVTVSVGYTGGAKDIQVEEGSTATTYEQYYNGGTATAQPLYKVGTYQDIQSVIDGEVTRNVGVKVLDGSENWTQVSGSSAPFALVVDDFESMNMGTSILVYSTHFQGVPASATWSNYNSIISFTGSQGSESKTFRVRYLANTKTLAEFKQFLAEQYTNGTPVICVYCKTATTETVTAQPLTIQAGTNIVEITQASMDDLELEVKYKAGVEVTIEEIENAQLDDNVEVTIQ